MHVVRRLVGLDLQQDRPASPRRPCPRRKSRSPRSRESRSPRLQPWENRFFFIQARFSGRQNRLAGSLCRPLKRARFQGCVCPTAEAVGYGSHDRCAVVSVRLVSPTNEVHLHGTNGARVVDPIRMTHLTLRSPLPAALAQGKVWATSSAIYELRTNGPEKVAANPISSPISRDSSKTRGSTYSTPSSFSRLGCR